MADLFSDQESQGSQGLALDFKRVIARAFRFWYLIVLSLVIAFSIAFYKIRYASRIYPISTSIIIRETQEVGGAELLYRNALVDQYRNYLNEPYVIRSYTLMEKVVRKLNFNIAFYREGYFMTSDSYEYMPVKASWWGANEIKSGTLLFRLLDEKRYQLALDNDEEKFDNVNVYSFGDSIVFDGYFLCLLYFPERVSSNLKNVPFLLTIQQPRAVAGSYISRLGVSWAEEGSGVINLSLTSANPRKEIDFLNALVKAYQEADLEKKNEVASRTIDFIRKQLITIKDSLRTVEFQLERFGNSSRVKDMSNQAQKLFTRMEGYEVQQSELYIRQNYFRYLDEYITNHSGHLEQVILPSSLGISDPILNELLSKIVDLQTEIRIHSDPDRTTNPIVKNKLERMEEIKKDVAEAVSTLKATDKIKMDFLSLQIKSTEDQLDLLPASERQLIAIQRNYSLLENLYVFLMQKLSEAAISRASNTSDIMPVNPPMAGSAISPRPSQTYTVAAILGLAIPLMVFVLFELINNKVQSKEDIEKMTTIPFIGGVGHNVSGNNLTVRERPKSGVAESFRAMRSNLNYFTGGKSKQVFMVSSSISGEGKTFTTINLSTVFALSGKRTLIVGADMRRPKIFEDFGRHNNAGLSTYLSGLNDFKGVVQDTDIENLFLVSGGPVPPNPSELLLTDRFEQFVKEALEQFDYVIIDTPPLALVTDAFVISKYADHTVFVLRQNFSPKQFIHSIDEYHRSGKIKSISILLNDIYKSGLGYGYGQGYAYHYGYSYGYGRKKKDGGYYSED